MLSNLLLFRVSARRDLIVICSCRVMETILGTYKTANIIPLYTALNRLKLLLLCEMTRVKYTSSLISNQRFYSETTRASSWYRHFNKLCTFVLVVENLMQ